MDNKQAKQLNRKEQQKVKPPDNKDLFWYNDSSDEQELRSVIGFSCSKFVKNNQDSLDMLYN